VPVQRASCYAPRVEIPQQEFPYLLLGYAVLFLAGLVAWLWRRRTLSGSKHWPATSGKVEGYAQGGYAVETGPWSVRNAPITLLYSYTVNAECFSGEVVLPRHKASNAAQARAALPVGTSIEVHYSPNEPERSIVQI
jgi:hypothetical protein